MSAPRKDAWTDAELQIIYDHLAVKNAARIVHPLLPGRTPSAIHLKLDKLRKEAGISVTRSHLPDALNRNAVQGSERLADAIHRELNKAADEREKRNG